MGLREEQQTLLHSEIKDKSCLPQERYHTPRKQHSEVPVLRPPEVKIGTGEVRNPLAPTTKLIPSKEKKQSIAGEREPTREPLCGSGWELREKLSAESQEWSKKTEKIPPALQASH